MGTRHKVKLLKDNKIIINQYGQWDGYPTTAGEVITNFLKNKENVEFLKNLQEKFIYKTKEEQDKFIFGEMTMNIEEASKEIYHYIFDEGQVFKEEKTGEDVRWFDLTTKQYVDEIYKKFGFEMTAYYLMITRDTGYKIFDTIKELNRLEPDKKIPVFLNDYNGFDIEATYTINLDKNTLEIVWHDKGQIYDLDNLPGIKELEEIEQAVRKMEEEEEETI